MGDFREDRGRGYRGRSSGRSGGFGGRRERSGGRDRDSGSFERRRTEMHTAICDKCRKQCEVPFRPTQGKPVYCSECFRKDGDYGSSAKRDFEPSKNTSQSGISSEQFNELNTKLDKILEILSNVQFEDVDEEDDEDEEEEK